MLTSLKMTLFSQSDHSFAKSLLKMTFVFIFFSEKVKKHQKNGTPQIWQFSHFLETGTPRSVMEKPPFWAFFGWGVPSKNAPNSLPSKKKVTFFP